VRREQTFAPPSAVITPRERRRRAVAALEAIDEVCNNMRARLAELEQRRDEVLAELQGTEANGGTR
jgi:hypothetical protein